LESESLETQSTESAPQADHPEGAESNAGLYAASLAALSLTACGGGGGNAAPPPPPPPPIAMSDAEAARFLQQAQFAATDSDIVALQL